MRRRKHLEKFRIPPRQCEEENKKFQDQEMSGIFAPLHILATAHTTIPDGQHGLEVDLVRDETTFRVLGESPLSE